MAGIGRNFWLAAALLATFAIGVASLTSTLWTSGLAAILSLVGVILFRGDRWRSGALLLSALAVSFVFLDALVGWFSLTPMGQDVANTMVGNDWAKSDPVLGYRLRPNTIVPSTATWGRETLYRVTYTIDADGWRTTPEAPAGADSYLFMGDSYVFGQGLDDDQTLAAQFAKAHDFKVHTANIAAPGYGPNHLVRAIEAGLLDRYADQPIKAVITWIIPPQLARVTGDEVWLGSSPRYVLDNGTLRYTGSFYEHRGLNSADALLFLARERFAFIKAIGMNRRQEAQGDLFVALIGRLQALARERFGAPLIVLHQWWPDETTPPGDWPGRETLVPIFSRVRRLGVPLISVDSVMKGADIDVARWIIPHDGHPTALVDHLVAGELKRRLSGP